MSSSANARVTVVPTLLSDDKQWKRGMATWALEASKGKLNNTGTVTLTSGVAATTITDARIGISTFIGLMPKTANAAGALSTTYISSQSKGAATVTHANAATGDRTFTYAILG